MFSSKAVEKLIENEDIESLLMHSALKPVGLPPDIEDMFVEEFCNDQSSSSKSTKSTTSTEQESTKRRKKNGYQPREFIERAPKEASAWYSRYLSADKRDAIKRGETDPEATPLEIKLANQFW